LARIAASTNKKTACIEVHWTNDIVTLKHNLFSFEKKSW
jgi:hypothetical protein